MRGGSAGMKEAKEGDVRVVATNRKAHHLYAIVETVEAGIELRGTEVKSLRASQVSFLDSYAIIEGGQVFLMSLHIAPYDKAHRDNHDPTRKRRLLLHRTEIRRLQVKVEQRGLTLVPLVIYFDRGYAKVELGLARGKKTHDRREAIREREEKREMERTRRREAEDR
jgi:SsrA-binding protein